MAGKKPKERPEAQSERFRAEAQRLIDAGELNPTEADEVLDKIVRASRESPVQP
jgi:polyhydroxyalkanoate synthesis regulator phasin